MNDDILHFGSVRIRVVGDANLIPTFYGFDKIASASLQPIILNETDSRVKTRLCNFVNEAGILRLETLLIDEYFKVNDITIFVKPMYTEYSSVVNQ